MYKLLRPLLWQTDAERAHDMTMALLRAAGRFPGLLAALRRRYVLHPPELAAEAFGVRFPACVGLAAGLDKNGRAVPALAALGFGFIEVGTVTPRPQPGHPKPRLWRLPDRRALINRMGFNNDGAAALAESLRQARRRTDVPIGVNIGKNRDTPAEEALSDYLHCLRTLYPLADYFVVNVSSPNTPGLRDLQRERSLDRLLSGITAERDRLAAAHGETKPVLVKVAPDMSPGELDAVVDVCLRRGAGGIVATNTTVARPGLRGPEAALPGGLSGAPLFDASTRTVAAIYRRVGGRLPVIGVGGVMSAADAYAKIKAGARLVQVLTGFVYGGPGFVRTLQEGLQQLLARDGLPSIGDAVGVEAEQIKPLV